MVARTVCLVITICPFQEHWARLFWSHKEHIRNAFFFKEKNLILGKAILSYDPRKEEAQQKSLAQSTIWKFHTLFSITEVILLPDL